MPAKSGRRLVEQQDGRADGERPGDLHDPLVDVGQGARELFHRPGIADEGEQRLGRLGRCAGVARRAPDESRPDRAEASPAERDLEVLPDRQVLEELRGLVGAGDSGARDGVGGKAGNVPVAKPYGTVLRAKVAAYQVEHGRLAGAVGADDAGDLAGLGAE